MNERIHNGWIVPRNRRAPPFNEMYIFKCYMYILDSIISEWNRSVMPKVDGRDDGSEICS